MKCSCSVWEMHLLTLRLSIINRPSFLRLGYPKVIPYTKFELFGIIRFGVMLQTNKQTNKQTDRHTQASTHAHQLRSAWAIIILMIMVSICVKVGSEVCSTHRGINLSGRLWRTMLLLVPFTMVKRSKTSRTLQDQRLRQHTWMVFWINHGTDCSFLLAMLSFSAVRKTPKSGCGDSTPGNRSEMMPSNSGIS